MHPFMYPLHYTHIDEKGQAVVMHACMYVSEAKVKARKHMYMRAGYVAMYLGMKGKGRKGGKRLSELGHRLVLTYTYGPPPLGSLPWEEAVVMHRCGHKDCLNPNHLVWGTSKENSQNSKAIYLEKVKEQGRRH